MLVIWLPEDIELRLANLAKKTGRTKTSYAREAILEYLDDLEDLYLAEKRLSNIKNDKTKTLKLGQLEYELGLVDWIYSSGKKKLETFDPQIAKRILKFLKDGLTTQIDPRKKGEALKG